MYTTAADNYCRIDYINIYIVLSVKKKKKCLILHDVISGIKT